MQLEPLSVRTRFFALAACGGQNAVVTGGRQSDWTLTARARRLSLTDDLRSQWEPLPQLNIARECHASCAIRGSDLYVFCGFDAEGSVINSIEQYRCDLKSQSATSAADARWNLISLPADTQLTPRTFPAVQALNSSEILIMGGRGDQGYQGDAVVFSTMSHTVTKIAQSTKFQF